MLGMFGITAVAAASFVAGLSAGRSMHGGTDMEAGEELTPEYFHRRKGAETVLPPGKEVGSPCSGKMGSFQEGSRNGATVVPDKGLLYAPAAGKIVRLYPMGNAFTLRTEFGAELFIRVGKEQDDLFSGLYRPRVVQNEIVPKGRLLLEFDLEGLRENGEDTTVTVSVETGEWGQVFAVEKEKIKAGEELFRISV